MTRQKSGLRSSKERYAPVCVQCAHENYQSFIFRQQFRGIFEESTRCIKGSEKYRQKFLDGKVAVWDLIVTKHLSKHPREYKQKVGQVIAAEQLMKERAEVHAGKNIRFLFADTEDKRYERRVKAAELIEESASADAKKYLLLLYAAAASLLSPLGYSTKEIYDAVRGYYRKSLREY